MDTNGNLASQWWNYLRNTRLCNGTKDKGYYTDKHFGFNRRLFKHLTDAEVEFIWRSEHNITEQ